MSAQSVFLEGMKGFQFAIDHEVVIEKGPTQINHNLRSRVFRNGITVFGFSVLEHFIRSRLQELFGKFDRISIPFDELPSKLKLCATTGALKGIQNQIRFNPDIDPVTFIQAEAQLVASTVNNPYKINSYSIGWEFSNLKYDDIAYAFNCFKIKDGWKALDIISRRLNMTIPSAGQSYKNAFSRRNSAAHSIDTRIQPSHLINFVRESFLIAIGFDLLISTAFIKLLSFDTDFLHDDNYRIRENDISLRFIEYKNGIWKERGEENTRANKTGSSINLLWPTAINRARKRNEFLIAFDENDFPCKWEPPVSF